MLIESDNMKPDYNDNFVENPETLFTHLRDDLEWMQLAETRQEYFMSDVQRDYSYGKGKGVRSYPSKPYSGLVLELRNKLTEKTGVHFDLCFLNRYDDQRNWLGWHADDNEIQNDAAPICVISLGAEREIWWKKQDYKGPIPPENRQLL